MPPFYRPPADIDDFSRRPAGVAAQLAQHWHSYISGVIRDADTGNLFYDAEFDPAPAQPPARRGIPWNGFPRSIWQWFNADTDPAGRAEALAAAEVLSPLQLRLASGALVEVFERQQDEYCEWHVDRNGAAGITRITFTCEGPEYFREMAEIDLSLVGDLYREYVNPAVQDADLIWTEDVFDGTGARVARAGGYNKWNKWTTALGVMHLTHQANTLGAEINLAADATVQYPVTVNPANTLPTRLICCAAYGGENRSSDPLIGAGVNALAASGLAVTLDNPVGLYMQDIALDSLRAPDGALIGAQALRILRASPDGSLILRAQVAPPAGANYTLDQCTFEGEPLVGGGQIARRITLVLFGLAKAIAGRSAVQSPCNTKCCRKPDTSGFLALVAPARNCATLSDDFWAQRGPVTAIGAFAAPKPTSLTVLSRKAGSASETESEAQ